MAPRLFKQNSKFGVDIFVSKKFWELRNKRNLKIYNFDPKVSEPCQNIDVSKMTYLFHTHGGFGEKITRNTSQAYISTEIFLGF